MAGRALASEVSIHEPYVFSDAGTARIAVSTTAASSRS